MGFPFLCWNEKSPRPCEGLGLVGINHQNDICGKSPSIRDRTGRLLPFAGVRPIRREDAIPWIAGGWCRCWFRRRACRWFLIGNVFHHGELLSVFMKKKLHVSIYFRNQRRGECVHSAIRASRTMTLTSMSRSSVLCASSCRSWAMVAA